MAHMDRISIGDIYGVHAIRFQARERTPDLVLPPRETPRRYMRQWGSKRGYLSFCTRVRGLNAYV